MFGDLDWPLNASCGLSAIAEFLSFFYVTVRYRYMSVCHRDRGDQSIKIAFRRAPNNQSSAGERIMQIGHCLAKYGQKYAVCLLWLDEQLLLLTFFRICPREVLIEYSPLGAPLSSSWISLHDEHSLLSAILQRIHRLIIVFEEYFYIHGSG